MARFKIGDAVYERDNGPGRVGTVTHILPPSTKGVIHIRVEYPIPPNEWVDEGLMEKASG